MATTYKHTQPGYVTVGFTAAAAAFALKKSKTGAAGIPLAALGAFLAGVGVVFSSLTINVRDGVLQSFFGPGIPAKTVALRDIESVEVVRNKWYYGWGVKYTPHGWLYNVSGLGAVEILLKNGDRFRLGTDEPESLLDAILSAKDELT